MRHGVINSLRFSLWFQSITLVMSIIIIVMNNVIALLVLVALLLCFLVACVFIQANSVHVQRYRRLYIYIYIYAYT